MKKRNLALAPCLGLGLAAVPAAAAGGPVERGERRVGAEAVRQIDLTRAAGGDRGPARIARLPRHLKARLEDFGPGGPQVVSAEEETGL